jgi:hypothetical protein
MTRLSIALCALAVAGITLTGPARADYDIIRWPLLGDCKIWDNRSPNPPWGSGWRVVAAGIPDYQTAWEVLGDLIQRRVCR